MLACDFAAQDIEYRFLTTEQVRRNLPDEKTNKFIRDIDDYVMMVGSRVLATV